MKIIKFKSKQKYKYKRKVIIKDLILKIFVGIHDFEKIEKHKQGDLVGGFKFGSTVVLIFDADKEEEWAIVIPGASTTGNWIENDLTNAGKLAKNIILN